MTFDYLRPANLAEAVNMLAEAGDQARVLAGATDLWVDLRAGKIAPKAIVSLKGLGELRGLRPERPDGGGVTLGALTPHAWVEDSDWAAAHMPAVQQACSGVGSRQVRNVGTVGGNICNAAPCADSATALLLFDAALRLEGPEGTRDLRLADFFVGPKQTRLLPGEILTEVKVADPGPRTFSRYIKHTRRKGVELAMMSVGVRLTLAEDLRTVRKARIALGICAPTPTCSARAESVLEGRPLTPENVCAAAEAAADDSLVRDTWRGRAWYRREMIRVLIPRAVEESGAYDAAAAADLA
ncbi:MAG: FAD binding domain-containing protein [Thermoleophilia bacterium]